MIQAELIGDKTFSDILRSIVLEDKRQELAARVREEKLRNIKFEDKDF
jgi:hypothetical protein